jgi:catechol 2,3-dioxygenase-like lactoylglutathione lyase family enzyme
MTIQPSRIVHLNLNLGSLSATLPLFTEHLGFASHPHGSGKPQNGENFGTTGVVQCSGRTVHRPKIQNQCVLQLLEWQRPPGVGPAYTEPWHTGISRLAIRTPKVDVMRARLLAAGVQCFAGPLTGAVSGERFFCCANGDGSVLQLVEHAGPVALHYVNINCTDLAVASRWYQQVLGFEAESDIWDETLPGEAFGLQGVVHTRSQRLTLCDRESDCIIQLQQWLEPSGAGQPYPEVHHLGYCRVALAVDDIEDSYRQLLQQGVECQRPLLLLSSDSGAVDCRALFFTDPDGSGLALIQVKKPGSEGDR